MTGPLVALVIVTGLGVIAAGVWMWWAPRRDAYLVTRGPEPPRAVLHARLIRSHRELPGRPPTASTARQVHVITDCRAAHQGARANREG